MRTTRRHFCRLAVTLFGTALMTAALTSRVQAGNDEAGQFLAALTDQAIGQLSDSALPLAERKEVFRVLFKENFDVPAIGRFVLGRYWRTASTEAQADFLVVFEEIMVQRFAPQFTGYGGTGFEISLVRPLKEKGQFIVSSTIKPPRSETIAIDWRVRESDGQFKILDVVGEGVSMALTLRSEYATVIKNAGGRIEGLTSMLRERVEQKVATGETASASQ